MSRILCRLKLLGMCVGVSFLCAQGPAFSPLNKVFVWQGGSNTIPIWSGGAFIAIDPAPNFSAPTSPAPNVYVSGDQGNVAIKLQIPGAVWTQNRGIARGKDGTIAASGSVKDASGQNWSYLAILAPGNLQPTAVHTDPYVATSLAIAPDGTIWAKGADYNPPGANGLRNYKKKSGNGLLRHFSASGELLGSALPQSGLTITQAVWGDKIAASANLVGWCQYDGFGGGPQPQGGSYFEISAGGDVSKTPLPPFVAGEMVDALAITDSGRVLLEKSVRGTNPKLYSLDRNLGVWLLVQFPAAGFEGTSYFMLGASRNQVAFWANGTTGFNTQLTEVQ